MLVSGQTQFEVDVVAACADVVEACAGVVEACAGRRWAMRQRDNCSVKTPFSSGQRLLAARVISGVSTSCLPVRRRLLGGDCSRKLSAWRSSSPSGSASLGFVLLGVPTGQRLLACRSLMNACLLCLFITSEIDVDGEQQRLRQNVHEQRWKTSVEVVTKSHPQS